MPLFSEAPEAPNGWDEEDYGDGAGFLCRPDADDTSWSGASWFMYPSEAPLRDPLNRNVPMLGSLEAISACSAADLRTTRPDDRSCFDSSQHERI